MMGGSLFSCYVGSVRSICGNKRTLTDEIGEGGSHAEEFSVWKAA